MSRGLPGLAQRQEARGDGADPARAPARRRGARPRRRGGVRRTRRGPADLRGQRAAQGAGRPGRHRAARPSPTTRGLCVDALNGMPGVLSARWSGPPEVATTATTSCCWPSSPTCPTSGAAPTSVCASAFCAPGGRRARRRAARCRAGSSARSGAPAGSATTWCSRPTTTPGSRPPSCRCRTRTRSATGAGRSGSWRRRWRHGSPDLTSRRLMQRAPDRGEHEHEDRVDRGRDRRSRSSRGPRRRRRSPACALWTPISIEEAMAWSSRTPAARGTA